MLTEVTRWNGTSWETLPPPKAGFMYEAADPITGEVHYFETRQDRDTWIEAYAIDGFTWKQWAGNLFQFEFCDECGGDADDHEPMIFMGNWFAKCKKEVPDGD